MRPPVSALLAAFGVVLALVFVDLPVDLPFSPKALLSSLDARDAHAAVAAVASWSAVQYGRTRGVVLRTLDRLPFDLGHRSPPASFLNMDYVVRVAESLATNVTLSADGCDNGCTDADPKEKFDDGSVLRHGRCVNGVCVCTPAFWGSDCSRIVPLRMTAPWSLPRITDVMASPVVQADIAKGKRHRLEVCIVVRDIRYSPLYNLALALNNAHHYVTVVNAADFEGGEGEDGAAAADFEAQVAQYAAAGITLVALPYDREHYGSPVALASYAVLNYLRQHDFDVVHLSDEEGMGYFSLLAKGQGELAMLKKHFVLNLVSPYITLTEIENDWDLEIDFMERRCFEMADSVVSPAADLVHFLHQQEGWPANEHIVVHRALDRESDYAEYDHIWANWNRYLKRLHTKAYTEAWSRSYEAQKRERPFVSVIMTHYNRPQYLDQAIESLEAQTYPQDRFELIIVDDGSTNATAIAALKAREAHFARKGWRILWEANCYAGCARNKGARAAKGKYLLFMDDDNYAMPHEISTFVEIMVNGEVDALTTFMEVTNANATTKPTPTHSGGHTLFLGGSANVGSFKNGFGDTNSFWRTKSFLKLGGFPEDTSVGYEDWALFANATMHGYAVDVVPEALFYYRTSPEDSNSRTLNYTQAREKALRPYLDALPEALHGILVDSAEVMRDADSLQAMIDKLERREGEGDEDEEEGEGEEDFIDKIKVTLVNAQLGTQMQQAKLDGLLELDSYPPGTVRTDHPK